MATDFFCFFTSKGIKSILKIVTTNNLTVTGSVASFTGSTLSDCQSFKLPTSGLEPAKAEALTDADPDWMGDWVRVVFESGESLR